MARHLIRSIESRIKCVLFSQLLCRQAILEFGLCRKIYGEWQGMMKGVDIALFIGTNALIANW